MRTRSWSSPRAADPGTVVSWGDRDDAFADQAFGDRRVVLVACHLSNRDDIADVFGDEAATKILGQIASRLAAAVCGPHRMHVTPRGLIQLALAVQDGDDLSRRLDRVIGEGRLEVTAAPGRTIRPVITAAMHATPDASVASGRYESLMASVVAALNDLLRTRPGVTTWVDHEAMATPRPSVGDELDLLRDLGRAIDIAREHRDSLFPGQLGLVYQPIRDLRLGRTVAFEALLRWSHPEHGAVPPLTAVGIAERSGLIGSLGSVVMNQALAALARFDTTNKATLRGSTEPVRMHVNVSPTELLDPGFALRVEADLGRYGVAAHRLVVEVTESACTMGGVEDALIALRRVGVGISLDDFGSGHSSLARLSHLPVDEVKIDRCFVDAATQPLAAFREPLLPHLLGLLDPLGVRVVVEGLADRESTSAVTRYGYRLGQGFDLGRPGSLPAVA